MIDTGHVALRKLGRELSLPLHDLVAGETRGTEPCYYFGGMPYSRAEASADFKKTFTTLQDDLGAADFPTVYNSHTARGLQLDQPSVIDWIRQTVPGGLGSRLGQLLDVAYNKATWEASRAQAGRSGVLVNLTGGHVGSSFNQGIVSARAQNFPHQIEPLLPGISSEWNGKAILDYWTGNPRTRGSYSYWKVGHYTKFAGIEGAQEGNCHFAGEHTSIEFQGFLNGAVESGERAAREIQADMGARRV